MPKLAIDLKSHMSSTLALIFKANGQNIYLRGFYNISQTQNDPMVKSS